MTTYPLTDRPICHLYGGSIGEAVRWAISVEHQVVETHCIVTGDAYCRFEMGDGVG